MSEETAPAGRRGRSRVGGSIWFAALIAAALVVVGVVVAVPGMQRSSSAPAPPPRSPLVVAALPFFNIANGTETVLRNRGTVNEVSPWMYGLDPRGRINHQYPPGREREVREHVEQLRRQNVPIVASLANITDGRWSYQPIAQILRDPARRSQHVRDIVDLVRREGFAGVDIDYENLRAVDREPFSAFVAELADKLHAERKTLSVALFAKTRDEGDDERNRAQDYAAIGRAADEVRLMGYDFHWSTSPPGPVAPIEWVREVLRYAKTRIPPERIVLGVPLSGYDWVDGRGEVVTWLQALRLSREHNAPPQFDPRSQSPWFRYTDERGREHEVWFENAPSSRAKFDVARQAGIRGVYLWMYGYEDPGTWDELRKRFPTE